MILTHTAKIYPSKTQEKQLQEMIESCRLFYNEVLNRKISYYKETGKNISRYDLQKEFKGKNVIPASLRQAIIYRVNIAFQRFYSQKSRFPRFKSQNRMRSIELRQYKGDYRIIGNKLKVWEIFGSFKMRGFRGGEISGMGRIVKKSSGWYFQYPVKIREKNTIVPKSKVGLDVGLKYFLADSEGNTVKPPQFFRLTQRKLALSQRKLCKSKRGSNRRKRRVTLTAKIHEKLGNQRKDWLHKLSRKYVDKYDLIAVENLNIRGMLRNHHLAKSISDASWDTFNQMLSYKLEMLGKTFIKVSPHYTSQRCICGANVPKSLSVRTHICPECGYIDDRDVVSAKLILKKARNLPTARAVQ